MDQRPSKFTVDVETSDLKIWEKILSMLTPNEQKQADKSKSEIRVPYLGAKEIVVRTSDNKDIAFAAISDSYGQKVDWSVYREN